MNRIATAVRFAARESRGGRMRLLLLVGTVAVGVALFAACGQIAEALKEAIQLQSKSLLGADLIFVRREPWDEGAERLIASIPGKQARETSFVTMLQTVRSDGTHQGRLATVRAVDPGFPFYGEFLTSPPGLLEQLQSSPSVLLERSAMLQLGVTPGASVRIGELDARVLGTVEQSPGESPIGELIAPRVYLAGRYVQSTGLLQFGSRATYRAAFQLPESEDAEAIARRLGADLDAARITAETVAQRRRAISESVERLERLLRLSSEAVLLLASIGIASGIAAFCAEKRRLVALLRAVGASTRWVLAALLVEIGLACGAAVLAGLAGGIGLSAFLPALFREVTPLPLSWKLRPDGIAEGALLGLVLPIAIAWPAVRRCAQTSPLLVLGHDAGVRGRWRFPWASLSAAVVITGALASLSPLREVLTLLAGVSVAVGVLFTVNVLLLWALRRSARSLPPTLRFAARNLFRPENRTGTLVCALTLALLLPATLGGIASMLNEQLRQLGGAGRPNLVLFGIDPGQRDAVTKVLRDDGAPVLETVPVVTMRLASLKGRPVRELLEQGEPKIPEWALRREYRSTYRNHLSESERLISGTFVPNVTGGGPLPVTVESGLAEKLQLSIGDTVEFDVQGVTVKAEVAGLRKVAWQQVRPNFFFVFPEGALSGAPATEIVTAHVEDPTRRASLADRLLKEFPNISFVDLQFVLRTVDSVLARLMSGAQVVSVAVGLTALCIVASIIFNDWAERLRSAALLKVLGARRRQLFAVTIGEYLLIGSVAAIVGGVGANIATQLLLSRVFELEYAPTLTTFLLTGFIAVGLAVIFGAMVAGITYRVSPGRLLREAV